ncbi:hypothetical protein LTS17_000778 [Exophiala oligosperma]
MPDSTPNEESCVGSPAHKTTPPGSPSHRALEILSTTPPGSPPSLRLSLLSLNKPDTLKSTSNPTSKVEGNVFAMDKKLRQNKPRLLLMGQRRLKKRQILDN